ncbi:hypothetical protein G6F56_009977 [Rhizopus delemar]|nr:hypothetical protein G6F56_009977 [Rhizopus delemar]
MRFPLRAIWDIRGYPTESLLWPAKKQENKTVLFFIPVSHKGHSVNYRADTARDKTLYSLEDQIQHKVECLDTLIEENGPETKIILIGHSIGAYISAEVLKKRPNHGIKRVIALFPTLRDIGVTPNGIYISQEPPKKLVNWVPTFAFGAAGSLISWMSPPLRQFLVQSFTKQSGPGLEVTAHQLLHSSVLKNVITMARFEMDSVKDLDHEFYNQHLEKFIIYYSENDQWAPKDHYDYMVEHFEKGNQYICFT